MNIRNSLACLIALPLVSPSAAFAQTPPNPAPAAAPAASAAAPAAPNAAPAAQEEKDTDLEIQMKHVGKAFRVLRKQVSDPTKNAASLKLVATMQEGLTNAAAMTPQKASDIPEDQRPKFIEDFKAGLKGMQDQLTKLSDALTAGKNDEATKIVAGIFDLEKKDHKEFRRPPKD